MGKAQNLFFIKMNKPEMFQHEEAKYIALISMLNLRYAQRL